MEMREMCEELYSEELKRIEEIPGISAQSATQIIAGIGIDKKMFLTARTLVGWAGLKLQVLSLKNYGKYKFQKGQSRIQSTHSTKIVTLSTTWSAYRILLLSHLW